MSPPSDDEGWTSADPSAFPEGPYPGERPQGSWRLTASGRIHHLTPSDDGWADLHGGAIVNTAQRHLILGYGSNPNPAKLADRFAGQEVFVLTATIYDWSAAWCDARRGSGDVVATLVPDPGSEETHAVIAVTAEQLQVMDRWEGHPTYYARQPFTGRCVLEDGRSPAVEVYLGTPECRPPLRRDGRIVRVRDVAHREVDRLVAPR